MISQAVLSVLVVLVPSGIMCAAISASSSAVSGSASSSNGGGSSVQFAQTQQFPGAGFGYNYGNAYPTYPTYNPYGQFYPGNQVQTASALSSRGSFGDDEQVSGQTTFNSYGPNSVAAPPVYNPYLNLQQQQQNAYFLQQQQQLLQQQLQQQQLQQQLLNFQNQGLGAANQGVSLDSRFSDDIQPSGGAGISTSSFTSSSDVNGKKAQSGGSQTVINKDGKTHVFTHRL